jgi:hypothetical protein
MVSTKSCEQSTWTQAKGSKKWVKNRIMDSILVYSDPENGVASLSKISLFINQHSVLSQSTWILIITAVRIWNFTSYAHGEMRNSNKILVGERANMWPFGTKFNGSLTFKWLGKRCSSRIFELANKSLGCIKRNILKRLANNSFSRRTTLHWERQSYG